MFLEATSYIHKDNVYKYSESGIVYDEIFQLQPLIFDILAVLYSLQTHLHKLYANLCFPLELTCTQPVVLITWSIIMH